MNGELVGCWTLVSNGQHEFRYADGWLESSLARPISLSMPLQPPDFVYRGERVEAFFDNLLPDSSEIRRRIRSRFATRSNSAFDLLTEIGRDCVGAIQLLAPDTEPQDLRRIDGTPLSEAQVAQVLRATLSPAPVGQRHRDGFRISIAGAQEKTALLYHDERWHEPHGPT
ncbi:MAG: HipA N-terminal domain-containing protein, partial [Gammaproteobacteria bacterium]